MNNKTLGDIFSQIQWPNKTAKVTVPIRASELPINTPYKSYIAAIVITVIWDLSPISLKHNINTNKRIKPILISLLLLLLLLLSLSLSLSLSFKLELFFADAEVAEEFLINF